MNTPNFNAVLKYLFNINSPVHASWIISQLGKQGENVKDLQKIVNEFKKMEIINIDLDFRGKETYLLNEPTRKLLKSMPEEFEDSPYDFLKDLVTGNHGQRKERWFLEMEELKHNLRDYRKTKLLALLAFMAALAILILELLRLLKVV